jgi:hypothetical protein
MKHGLGDGSFGYGIPVSAGMRFPADFDLNDTSTLSSSKAPLKAFSMLIFIGILSYSRIC